MTTSGLQGFFLLLMFVWMNHNFVSETKTIHNLTTFKSIPNTWSLLLTYDFFNNSLEQIELIELIRQISTETLTVF